AAWRRHRRKGLGPEHETPEDVCIFNIFQKLARLAHVTHDDSLLDIVRYVENIAQLAPHQRNVPRPSLTAEGRGKFRWCGALALANRASSYANGVTDPTGTLDEGE